MAIGHVLTLTNYMTLQLIVGRQHSDIRAYVMDEVKSLLHESAQGKPVFYIVPEQMTFQQEYQLFQDETIKGSIRAQIVSFSRLAWRVLQETGGGTKQFISSTGVQMMLRKIIEQRTDTFEAFQKAVDKQGFIQELDGMITEFKRHNITPEMLAEHKHYAQDNPALLHKLEDLHYMYMKLMGLLEGKYIDGEDQLQLLVEKIAQTSFLQDASFYIEGFYRFTPKELHIIGELLKAGKQVTVALIADPDTLDDDMSELDLFYQTTETYRTLKKTAAEYGVAVEKSILLAEEEGLADPYFHHLEKHFDTRPAPTLDTKQACPIHLVEAVHPRAEVEGIIQEILRLVREEDYRYRDIVLYVRETATYHDLIDTMFHDYRIPVFIDEKRTMLNHPFIEFLRSFFDVVETNWRYDALFRLLKTGYLIPTNEAYPLTTDAIDQLENYCLEFGIRKRAQWTGEDKWLYKRFRGFDGARQTDAELVQEEKINAYRAQVTDAFAQFDKKIRKKQSVKQRCIVLYELLEALQIPSQLERQQAAYDEAGRTQKGREEEQVWQAVMQLLDEMVEMIGEETISFATFRKTFEAGLEALEFSHVPPTIDHIIVGSIDHSRIAPKKCAFLLGVNEGAWPMKPPLDGMMNERERAFLKEFGMELAADSRRVLLDDQFYMYLAFTSATEYMSVSYVLSDHEGKMKMPSPMIGRMQSFFAPLQQAKLLTDPDELQDAARFITTKEKTRAALTVQLARYLRQYPMEDVWWSVLDWYMKNEEKHETTYNVLQSLFYENKPVSLSTETVKKLHPKQVKTSVSRLEMFYRCSYQHFVHYGLQLEERRTYKLDAPDIGQLFHEALKTIAEWLQKEGTDFGRLTEKDAQSYARKSMDFLAPALQHHILSSSNRYQYMKQKLEKVIAQATYILSEQARASGFSPVGIELGFGEKETLDPLQIALPNDYELILRGRIDRVDKLVYNDQLYLRIIDYKSSSRGLDLVDVYYGLALQMLTYLEVVLSQAEDWLGIKASPAGILYFHVHDAMLSTSEKLTDEKIVDEIFKRYKMTGLVTDETAITQLMDTETKSGWSDIIPVGFKKDGSYYAGSKVATDGTFQLLQNYMQKLIVGAGIDITSGHIALNPFENKNMTACTFCDFKSVCQFDPILTENNYRTLKQMKDGEIIDKIAEEIEEV